MPLKNGNPKHELTHEDRVKGGKNGRKSDAEKKTIRKIVEEFLEGSVCNLPQVKKLAEKLGLERDSSIKELFAIVCVLNTLKDGKLGDLDKLVELLGEEQKEANNGILDKLTEFLKNDE